MESGYHVSSRYHNLLGHFEIVIGDTNSPGGNAYFDDIQLASGTETGCMGIDIPEREPPGQVGYSDKVVDRLATLLTAGRLSTEGKSIIVVAFNNAGSAEDDLRVAQQLILTTAEFHTTDIVKNSDIIRDSATFPQSTGKPYRAVIYMMLNGGCDRFNMLAPYTCNNNLYESYLGKLQKIEQEHSLVKVMISAVSNISSSFTFQIIYIIPF